MTQVNSREIVVEILLKIEKEDVFANEVIGNVLKMYQFIPKQTRAFINKLAEGTIEHQIQLDYIINQFSKTKINKCKPLIRVLLRMSAYQILFLDRVPDRAVCDEAVKIARKKGFHNLTGFVNGVLRNISRNKENISYPKEEEGKVLAWSVHYSMPEWIVEKFLKDFGEEKAKKILEASMEERDTCIRVNTSKLSKEECIKKLEKEEVTVKQGCYAKDALRIEDYDYLSGLTSFQEGDFNVQDESSQLLCEIADIKKDYLVLDVCSAPGGKTLHAVNELKGTGLVIARDLTEKKTELILENVERMGYQNVRVEVFDALNFDENMKEKADLVIADLPCSGLGILGRKKDIKYSITKEQLLELKNMQRSMLEVVSGYVKKGGYLIFSTCTINPEENLDNYRYIIEKLPFQAVDITSKLPDSLQCETAREGYIQLLQGIHDCDGFFISKFQKK